MLITIKDQPLFFFKYLKKIYLHFKDTKKIEVTNSLCFEPVHLDDLFIHFFHHISGIELYSECW